MSYLCTKKTYISLMKIKNCLPIIGDKHPQFFSYQDLYEEMNLENVYVSYSTCFQLFTLLK